MKLFLVIVVIFAISDEVPALTLNQLMHAEWQEYKLTHKKVYESMSEEQYRWNIYLRNREIVALHNQRYAMGLETYDMGLNHLADMTYEEFLQQCTGINSSVAEDHDYEYEDDSEVGVEVAGPKLQAIDWRDRAQLGRVKDQGKCNSCWAFAAVTALEHYLVIQKQQTLVLSEQQLVDCSRSFGNDGCRSGQMGQAYEYIKKNGITREDIYPYHQRDDKCHYNGAMRKVSIRGYRTIKANFMQVRLDKYGPMAATIYASKKFQLYKSGIFNDPDCSQTANHGIVIIGYGQEGKDEYWIIQNSWGEKWGEKGYGKMLKNKNNQCGISSRVTSPVL